MRCAVWGCRNRDDFDEVVDQVQRAGFRIGIPHRKPGAVTFTVLGLESVLRRLGLLRCKHSASAADVDLLLAVEPAKVLDLPAGTDVKPKLLPVHLVNTDPPYNVRVEGSTRDHFVHAIAMALEFVRCKPLGEGAAGVSAIRASMSSSWLPVRAAWRRASLIRLARAKVASNVVVFRFVVICMSPRTRRAYNHMSPAGRPESKATLREFREFLACLGARSESAGKRLDHGVWPTPT